MTEGLGLPSVTHAGNGFVVLGSSAWFTTLPAINKPSPGYSTGYSDAYIALFDATNGAYRSAVYFGGNGNDDASAIAVDAAGDLVVAGSTSGPNFAPSGLPVTNPLEAGPVPGLSVDGFVAKFHLPDLSLTFSTLFGGPGGEDPGGMALDARGNLWMAGVVQLWRTNAQLPTLNAFQPQPGGGGDVFLVDLSFRDRLKMTRSGQTLVFSWPAAATGYQLESTANLESGVVWESVATPPVVIGDEQVVTVDIGPGSQFFRLRKP
jgi:hypothetical protein